ncbi:hypothetical protein RB195_018205 [Necator americanus]|uniref:Uncharacterized protein n=1 Tax=Necator americanus TaxID=51031 RepID=A0ABR1CCB4_NECAM
MLWNNEELYSEMDVMYPRMAQGEYQHIPVLSKSVVKNRLRFLSHNIGRSLDRLFQAALKLLTDTNWKRPLGRGCKLWTEVMKEDLKKLGIDRQFG